VSAIPDGAEGIGYTYTVDRNGGAIADALRREIPELIEGHEADDTEAIWRRVWWALHYGGRGGPPVLALSALDIALWDLRRAEPMCRCFVCSAASTLAYPVMPEASTSISP
jgi:L-alanine-DL-glutamate epimerase-like enolase superfamily enzyme